MAEDAIEEVAPDRFDPALVGEPTDEPGSVAAVPDEESEVAIELDPWTEEAEEVAEAVKPPRPAYEVVVNDKVQYFVDRYTGDRREVVSRWFGRSTRYLDMIHEVLRARGLPEELAFVAMIESGYDPKAVSRAGAKGMWQFMAATARRYGLRVDRWVDERLDPVKSTYAAAAYLNDLHTQFGSWTLAKAGYNAGEVKVARAIRLTGTSDFWVLAESRFLRQETKNYVPAIHAATLIGRDPARYGFENGFEPATSEPPATATVRVPPRTTLASLAAKGRIPLQTLRALNPVLIRATTPPGPAYDLIVPEEAAEQLRVALAPRKPTTAGRARKARPAGDTADIHVVRPNETIKGIALHYGVTVTNLMRWNSLADPDLIRAGDRLRVAEIRVSAEPAAGPR
jgi:membrane-bound lytic murein transglycosylase D